MARRHGQHGALYVDISVGGVGTASLVLALNDSKRSFATDTVEVTAYEDGNKVYLAGKPDASATYAGFLETTSDQLYNAARDGLPRKFYDYIDSVNDPNKYFFGTAIFDWAIEQGTSKAVTVTANMKAASTIGRVWL